MKRNNAFSECFSLNHVTIDDAITPNLQHISIGVFKNPTMNPVELIRKYVNSKREIVYRFKSLGESRQWLHGRSWTTTLKGAASLSNIFAGGVGGYFVGYEYRRSAPKAGGRIFTYSPENDYYEIYTPFLIQIFGSERKHYPLLKVYREEVESAIVNNSIKPDTSEIIKKRYSQSKSRKRGR